MPEDPKAQEHYLEQIVWGIVEHPGDVVVERSVDDQGVLLTLAMHQDDMGKIIGRGGHTAQAIRTLLRAMGARMKARVSLKILEPAVPAA